MVEMFLAFLAGYAFNSAGKFVKSWKIIDGYSEEFYFYVIVGFIFLTVIFMV